MDPKILDELANGFIKAIIIAFVLAIVSGCLAGAYFF